MEKISNFRGAVREDDAARAVYSEAAGIGQVIPRAVLVPADADDVVTAVKWAAAQRIPLIPRGSGSSMASGAIGDGVILDLSRLRSMDVVDVEHRSVRVEPGVLRNEVDAAAQKLGLSFPVDPSSGAFCTVGGMASTNAAGARTMRYGAMREWVNALDCVFADGSRATIRRGQVRPRTELLDRAAPVLDRVANDERNQPSGHRGIRKESSGYGISEFAESNDLIDLLIGSEGTLAIIVGLELRLMPLEPNTASLLASFATFDEAVAATSIAREMQATCCELLDRTFLDVARRGGSSVPAPENSEAVLLTEISGTVGSEVERNAELLAERFRDVGALDVAVALDSATEDTMWELRHAASPALARLDPALKSMQFIEDGCVPPEKLGEYVTGVRAALDRQKIRGVIFGHAGDAHVHVNPLIDVRVTDWRKRAEALLDEVTALVARLGGTLAGEHGDGRLRTPLLRAVWSASALSRFADVKHAFDPIGILNPGVKVALPGEQAIDRVKYDPSLPPLPQSARRVLSRIERERAYSRFRLDLLTEAEFTEAKNSKSS
jgi:FAD/FMN-containing dehydrogenase